MTSEFDTWNIQKQSTHKRKHVLPNEKEVWWVRIGKNIGFEQNGKGELFLRPVLVFRLFNSKMFFGIPMSSGSKNEKSDFCFKVTHNEKQYFLLLPQARLFSTKRLQQLIRTIDSNEFMLVKKAFRKLYRI